MRIFGMRIFGTLYLVFVLVLIVSWPVNIYRLTQCDFDNNRNWKGEIVYTIGVFTPACVVTAWMDLD